MPANHARMPRVRCEQWLEQIDVQIWSMNLSAKYIKIYYDIDETIIYLKYRDWESLIVLNHRTFDNVNIHLKGMAS